ncbi:hypothetical protein [Amycolatopsis sp. 3B14]|uniref:hypothetical protein n=1 Tax=Amycolatopsis sp. 3B14 TaxID=3243600 RepID=UPI003D971F55
MRRPVVADLMTHPVASVVPAMPFKNVARLLDRTVEQEVLRHRLWAAPQQARAGVVDGVGTLTGTVDRPR